VIEAQSKDVQLSGFTQHLSLRLDRGNIELRPGKEPVPPMTVVLRAGDIELALPPQARFNLNATARQGEIQNDYSETGIKVDQDGDDDRGRASAVSVNTAGPEINLLTERGVIRLRRLDPAEVSRGLAPSVRPPSPPPAPPAQPQPQRLRL
jgi:hypothetical protein